MASDVLNMTSDLRSDVPSDLPYEDETEV